MRWAFRIATSAEAGGGHIARCRAVAETLGTDHEIFIDSDSLDWLNGYSGKVTRERSVASAHQLLKACERGEIDCVIIDTYTLPEQSITRLSSYVFVVMFRDFGEFGDEALSVEIRPARSAGNAGLSGLEFAPLPREYAEFHSEALRSSGMSRGQQRILVSFGLRDSVNCTGMALTALAALDSPVQATVVMGKNAPHLDQISKMVARYDWANLSISPTKMEELYLAHDIALGAPGHSQIERACCGLPTVLVPQNDGQSQLAKEWSERDAALASRRTPEEITDSVTGCLKNPTITSRVRKNGLRLVDGRGAARLADAVRASMRGSKMK